jgi:hypothetical protein
MEYPEEVQSYLDVLKSYEENKNLEEFNLFHMYPEEELCYPNGYYDSRWFNLVGYNTKKMEFKYLGKHDGLDFEPYYIPKIDIARIYADGSTLIRFYDLVNIDLFQAVRVKAA